MTLDGVAGSTQNPYGLAQVVIYDAVQGSWSSSTTAIWLSVTPRAGKDDERITVTADASRLAPGTYNGAVMIHVANAINSPFKFDVTLRVRAPEKSALRGSPATVAFTAFAGAADPAPVRLAVVHQGEQILSWTAAASTLNGGDWLKAAKSAGKTPDELLLTANTARLLPGTYSGRVTLASPDSTNGSVQIPVSVTVGRRPLTLSPGSIVNVANYEPGPVAPGQLLALFGKDFGPPAEVSFEARGSRVPEELAGTTVTFDGRRAPVLMASGGQVTVQVPYEVEGRAETRVKLSTPTGETNEVSLRVVPVAPVVIKLDEKLALYGPEAALVDAASTIQPGALLRVMMGGLGATSPRTETGDVVAGGESSPAIAAPVRATLGGRLMRLVSTGLVPGLVSIGQLIFEIPDLTDGVYPLEIAVGDVTLTPISLGVRAAAPAAQN